MLWWLAEHKSPVFTVMTTNDSSVIPKELFRSGRIDRKLTLPKLSEVEALAEWLRLATVTRVQRLPADKVRPFAESGGREGWLAVAQDLRALVEAKCAEVLMEYGDGFLYVGMSDDGRPEYDTVKMDALIARVLGAAK